LQNLGLTGDDLYIIEDCWLILSNSRGFFSKIGGRRGMDFCGPLDRQSKVQIRPHKIWTDIPYRSCDQRSTDEILNKQSVTTPAHRLINAQDLIG
jgi:hypothetical protein